MKITFMGAGSTVFARNVLGDSMCSEALCESEIALYDIDAERLNDSYVILNAINENVNSSKAIIKKYCGVENRKDALRKADFVINAIQVGFYDPCTITDFEIPNKYGLRQTIADSLGIGGIMRALRTIPVLDGFVNDMQEVCPDAWFLNYTNPMAILSGYLERYSGIKTIGLCHSVQKCTNELFKSLGIEDKLEGHKEFIAGINHMAWLLKIEDKFGNDLYPEIKKLAASKNENEIHNDMIRFDYIKNFGYYCTESSEHNAEYTPYYIKSKYPELIKKYNIPLDDYIRRCKEQIEGWNKEKLDILNNGKPDHKRSNEYASYIMESMVTGTPYKIGGNVINNGLIENLPNDACVEVPCLVDNMGIHPCRVGKLPIQLAALNITNINTQLLTINAARTKRVEDIYLAAMLDPHTSAELSIDDIKSMVDELIKAHGDYMKYYH